MSQYFAARIALLRNERKLSQKQVAADLGISPAVLSHYEKGVRECKLAFLANIADYYEVSCDYLLGRTSEPSGGAGTAPAAIKRESLPTGSGSHRAHCSGQKKRLVNTMHILYDVLARCRNRALTDAVSHTLLLLLYALFHILYSSNSDNPVGIFRLSKDHATAQADAAMTLSLSKIKFLLKRYKSKGGEQIRLSPKLIYERYPAYASSLFSLLEKSEAVCSEQIAN